MDVTVRGSGNRKTRMDTQFNDQSMPNLSPKVHIKRPHLFLLVGGFNTLADFTCYTLLTLFIFKEPSQIAIAGVISGTIALVIAFLSHNYITWRERETSPITIVKFFIVTGFGMWVIRPILLSLFITFTPLYTLLHTISSSLYLPFSSEFIANTCAFLLMTVVLLIYNYFAYDRLTFSPQKTRKIDKSH